VSSASIPSDSPRTASSWCSAPQPGRRLAQRPGRARTSSRSRRRGIHRGRHCDGPRRARRSAVLTPTCQPIIAPTSATPSSVPSQLLMPARPLVAARDSPPHGCPSRPNDSSPPGGARPHPHFDGDRVGNGARVAVGSGGCPQRYGCTEPAGQFRHRPGDQLSAGHTFGAEAADAGEDPAAFGPGTVFRQHHRHVHILPGIALNTRLSVRDGSAGGTGAGFRGAWPLRNITRGRLTTVRARGRPVSRAAATR